MFSKVTIVSVMVVVLFLSPLTSTAHAYKIGQKFPPVKTGAPVLSWLKSQSRYKSGVTQWFLIDRHWKGGVFGVAPGLVVDWDGKASAFKVICETVKNECYIKVASPTMYYTLYNDKIAQIGETPGHTWLVDVHDVKGFSLGFVKWYEIDNHLFEVDKVPEKYRIPQTNFNEISTTQRCEWHDALCWISQGITSIGNSISEFFNGFVKVIQNLMEFIGQLFVPGDDNIFLKSFNQLNDYMHKKLGFLTYPFDFLSSIFNTLMVVVDSDNKAEWHCVAGSPHQARVCAGLCAPRVLGDSPLCLKFTQLETVFPPLWTSIIFVVRFCVVVGLVELMRVKYYSVVRS